MSGQRVVRILIAFWILCTGLVVAQWPGGGPPTDSAEFAAYTSRFGNGPPPWVASYFASMANAASTRVVTITQGLSTSSITTTSLAQTGSSSSVSAATSNLSTSLPTITSSPSTLSSLKASSAAAPSISAPAAQSVNPDTTNSLPHSTVLGIAIGVSLGGVLLFTLGAILTWILHRRRDRRSPATDKLLSELPGDSWRGWFGSKIHEMDGKDRRIELRGEEAVCELKGDVREREAKTWRMHGRDWFRDVKGNGEEVIRVELEGSAGFVGKDGRGIWDGGGGGDGKGEGGKQEGFGSR